MRPTGNPFGLSEPSFFADPYAAYAEMRTRAPVSFAEPWRMWVLTRHADVVAAFRDRRLSAQRSAALASRFPPAVAERLAPLTRNLAAWALLLDPPAHTRVRALINKAFTPRVVEALRPKIVELAAELVDDAVRAAADHGGVVDVVEAIANPLPVLVIGDLLGLPRSDGHLLKDWSDALAHLLGTMSPGPPAVAAACDAVVNLEAYFGEALAARRRARTDDLLSALVTAEEQGTLMSEQEVVSTCSMLLFGGHETTTNLVTNAVYTLARHPDELARLRATGPTEAAMDAAVEEVLRYESPVQRIGRVSKEPMTVAGVDIPAGEPVCLMMGAANRDPAAFRDADRFDPTRADNRHLTLGHGTHYCVGAALGRMEARHVLSELLRRVARYELVDAAPAWLPNETLRGMSSLRIAVTPTTPARG